MRDLWRLRNINPPIHRRLPLEPPPEFWRDYMKEEAKRYDLLEKCMAACIEDNDPLNTLWERVYLLSGGYIPKKWVRAMGMIFGSEAMAKSGLGSVPAGKSPLTSVPSEFILNVRKYLPRQKLGSRGVRTKIIRGFRAGGTAISSVVGPIEIAYGLLLFKVETDCLCCCWGKAGYRREECGQSLEDLLNFAGIPLPADFDARVKADFNAQAEEE